MDDREIFVRQWRDFGEQTLLRNIWIQGSENAWHRISASSGRRWWNWNRLPPFLPKPAPAPQEVKISPPDRPKRPQFRNRISGWTKEDEKRFRQALADIRRIETKSHHDLRPGAWMPSCKSGFIPEDDEIYEDIRRIRRRKVMRHWNPWQEQRSRKDVVVRALDGMIEQPA